jgi:hypothetical protein
MKTRQAFSWIGTMAIRIYAALLLLAAPAVSSPTAMRASIFTGALVQPAPAPDAGQTDAERMRQRRLLAGLIAGLLGAGVVRHFLRQRRKISVKDQ